MIFAEVPVERSFAVRVLALLILLPSAFATATLWVAMWYHWYGYNEDGVLSKGFWFLCFIFLGPLASIFYYFFPYRWSFSVGPSVPVCDFLELLTIALCTSLVMAQSQTTPDLQHAQRLILVTTPDWNTVDGTLTRYSRLGGKWKQFGEPIHVVVGKNGLAWDPQLAAVHTDQFPGPVKHEGDSRAPAGIFKLSESFGFDNANALGVQNYLQLTPATECVDDPKSKHYAHIVDRNSIKDVDWSSSEKMRDIDLYRLGVVVSYNMSQTVPSNGSCIFLHIWRGPGHGTAGCTAMPEQNLRELIRWLHSKTPTAILIQLPQPEYQRLKTRWNLP
jgi:L,D-peptidoglycan transpeptidase YkuD (ErfK/YbiS/YcfS/YnhG family)